MDVLTARGGMKALKSKRKIQFFESMCAFYSSINNPSRIVTTVHRELSFSIENHSLISHNSQLYFGRYCQHILFMCHYVIKSFVQICAHKDCL